MAGRALPLLRRAGRRTNLALLIVLVGAFLSGWAAFAAGTSVPARLATVGHGLLGIGVLALTPWKTVVVRRAPVLRLASLALAAVIILCLAAGFVEVFAGYGLVGGISPIQVHVGAAFVAVPLLAWHLVRHPRQAPLRTDLGRRQLLRTAGFIAAVVAGYAVLEVAGRLARLPSARRIASGSHRISPNAIPATIWLLDRVPEVPADHRVQVDGNAVSMSELTARGSPVQARLDCTSGWFADAEWSGVPLTALVAADRLAGATSIVVTSVTGYHRRFPVADADALWLATGFQGGPLTAGTGAPVRLVAPNRRGFWWVKWVASVELSDAPAYAQSPFPLQ
ncbi:MAG TPA: molybdopterin-dependent oxidoreductase [Propionibacteriaceae bacterium]|nr:molybdopterin-dependent oxidoreductase [Propionibacteriaceae bacterium]